SFNPRAPGGARQFPSGGVSLPSRVSIHAPRVGRDADALYAMDRAWWFQSTRPGWGATVSAFHRRRQGKVSIHAPRVGRDVALTVYRPEAFVFQSARPGWGATAIMDNTGATSYVSIHAPRVGRDRVYRKERIAIQSFNPR